MKFSSKLLLYCLLNTRTTKSVVLFPSRKSSSRLLITDYLPTLTQKTTNIFFSSSANCFVRKKLNYGRRPLVPFIVKRILIPAIMSPVQHSNDSPVVPAQVQAPSTSTTIADKTTAEGKTEQPMEMDSSANVPKLYFVKMTENASTPTKGSKYAAGYDLKSAYDAVIPKRGSCLVKTDIQIQLPPGTYGRVAPRSGLALKNKIDVGAGVIDEDYRGNIGVILFNHADEDFIVTKGDRIAQLICEKITYPEVVEVESLEDSVRGADGFGSTGGVKKMKTGDSN